MATYASWRSSALAGGKVALSNITDATSATDVNGTDCDKTYWEANAYDQLYSMFTLFPSNPDKGVDGDLWINYDATSNADSKLVFQTNNNVSSTNPEILWDASETHFAFNNAVKVTGTLQATGNITGTFAGTLASSATSGITSLGTLTALQVDSVNINSSTISNSGGSILVEGTTFNGNDVTIAGNLTVSGTQTYLNTATLDVEDKNIQVNKNSNTANAIDSGLTILGDSNTEVGYFKVGSTGYGNLLLFKAPAGEQFKINATAAAETITIGGSLNIEADSNINQDVTTDASVTFGQLDVDNLQIAGNTVSSTDTNGNILLDPNGAGTVKIRFQNGNYLTVPNADGNSGQVLSTNGSGTLSWINSTSSTLSALTDTTVSSPVDGHVLIYDQQTSAWRNKEVTGDISITDGGVTAIASGVIVNADINSSAAIADSKLATITTGNKVAASAIQQYTNSALENSSGLRIKANFAGSGLSMTSGGGNQTIDIASGGISTAMIADDAVTADKIADGVLPSAYNYWTLAVGGTSANVLSGYNVYFAAGNGLDITYETSVSGGTDKLIAFSHEDTSSQANVDNSGTTYIQDITFDTYGHVTGVTSADHSHSGYLATSGGALTGVLTSNSDVNINSSLLYVATGYSKVGIGYTPSSGGGKLEVYGGSSWADSGESLAKFRSSGSDARIHINSTSPSGTFKAYTIYEDGNTSSKFSTGLSGGAYKITTGTTLSGTERLKVDSSGNWDIGTTGTDYNHNFHGDTGAKFYWKWYSGGGIDKYNYTKLITPGGAASFTLTHLNCSGSELSGGDYVLVVGGEIQCTSVDETSDSRVKTNINNIDSALDTVTQLQGVTFDWQDNEDLGFDTPPNGDRTQFGLIAQDVEGVLPEIVNSQGDAIKSIKKSSIIPFLIEAIKELKEEIETLKAGS